MVKTNVHHHETVHPSESHLTLYAQGDVGKVALAGEVVDPLLETWQQQRERLTSLPVNEQGLDLDSVREHESKMGLSESQILFLDPESYKRAVDIANESEAYTRDSRSKDSGGRYLFVLDVIIVQRDPELEALNGVGLTAGSAVHEVTHSASMLAALSASVMTRKKRSLFGSKEEVDVTFNIRRFGSRVRIEKDESLQGKSLEEGIAELERGYFNEEIGRPNGLTDEATAKRFGPLAKYSYYDRNDKGDIYVTRPEGAYLAVVLENLVAADPDLLPAIRARTSVEGSRDMVRRINKLVPGLYKRMRELEVVPNDEESMAKVGDCIEAARDARAAKGSNSIH